MRETCRKHKIYIYSFLLWHTRYVQFEVSFSNDAFPFDIILSQYKYFSTCEIWKQHISGKRCFDHTWRHETFSASLAICAGNSPIPGEFRAQRPVTRSFDVFFDLRLNKRLSKQSWGWWFETPSRSLWRHGNGVSPWKPMEVINHMRFHCSLQSLHAWFYSSDEPALSGNKKHHQEIMNWTNFTFNYDFDFIFYATTKTGHCWNLIKICMMGNNEFHFIHSVFSSYTFLDTGSYLLLSTEL